MNRKIKRYIFTAFGFPVILHDIVIKETDCGEEFPDINIKNLELTVAKALTKNFTPFNGAKLKFLRTFLKFSLRELGNELSIPHTNIKYWEDNATEKTGLETSSENHLRHLTLIYIQSIEQKELFKNLFKSQHSSNDLNSPLEIDYKKMA